MVIRFSLKTGGRRLLQGAEQPLHAAAALRAVGGDVLDAELRERPTHLGQMPAVDLAAGLRRDK